MHNCAKRQISASVWFWTKMPQVTPKTHLHTVSAVFIEYAVRQNSVMWWPSQSTDPNLTVHMRPYCWFWSSSKGCMVQRKTPANYCLLWQMLQEAHQITEKFDSWTVCKAAISTRGLFYLLNLTFEDWRIYSFSSKSFFFTIWKFWEKEERRRSFEDERLIWSGKYGFSRYLQARDYYNKEIK